MFISFIAKYCDPKTEVEKKMLQTIRGSDKNHLKDFIYMNHNSLLDEGMAKKMLPELIKQNPKALILYRRFNQPTMKIQKLSLKMIYLALKKNYFDVFPDSFKHYFWVKPEKHSNNKLIKLVELQSSGNLNLSFDDD